MSSTFPLPQELLEAVIRALGRSHANGSMATMLRVNKYVCSITLPILYGGVPISVLNQSYPKDSLAFKRRQKLIATLLLGVPKTRVTDLLRVAFLQDSVDDQEHSPAPYAPYHSFAIAISLSRCDDAFDGDFCQIDGFFQADGFFEDEDYYHDDVGPPSQRLLDFVRDHKLKERYATEAPLGRLLLERAGDTFTIAINREIHRDLTWALCWGVERLRYLVIPVSDIDRYLPLVDKFKALSRVKFELDRRLFPSSINLQELTPEQLTVLSHQWDERKQHLDQMVLFVQGLRHHHGSVLQAASCSGEFERCPDEYEEKLSRLLPPLPDPELLNIHNWGHFATKVRETNLSAVKTIMPPQNEQGALSLPRLLEQSPFLHRCRSLGGIWLTSLTDDIFQWAVDERRQYDADVSAGRPPQRPLVPLRYAEVNNERPTDGRLINDIGYSFGETLQSLEVRPLSLGWRLAGIIPDSVECWVGGRPSWPCWRAPLLSHLTIDAHHNLLRIHPSLFAQCPQLKSIDLADRRQRYSASDITRFEPTELIQLETLRLQGSPAISFHPSVLRNARELKSLVLRMANYDTPSYIPPVSELEEPVEELEDDSVELFTSEFAYRFQFSLLRSTPSLERFLVDARSLSGQHKRTFGVKDLLQNAQDSTAVDDTLVDDNDDDTLDQLQLQYIHLPNLTEFSLIGDWTLDRRVLTILCGKVLPTIHRYLSLRGCSGFGLHDWVKTTSKHLPELQSASASFEVTPESASEVGLVLEYDGRGAGNGTRYRLADRPPVDANEDATEDATEDAAEKGGTSTGATTQALLEAGFDLAAQPARYYILATPSLGPILSKPTNYGLGED
ncbi:hypothetical protein K457DRAFT_16156 [Linnemannia elongata AG-77]|uniref:Uncharacterized protein n=1 Tax=Linnemannia elongata AG-77 TaxID=1314771 RepID=A0A197K535_9FUNG|nr:hypothetical protein K457DRAFT_16156 [Linnemannia elongata AG-77]